MLACVSAPLFFFGSHELTNTLRPRLQANKLIDESLNELPVSACRVVEVAPEVENELQVHGRRNECTHCTDFSWARRCQRFSHSLVHLTSALPAPTTHLVCGFEQTVC